MVSFSLILPTRQRVSKLKDFLYSVKEMTQECSNIEIIICYDRDDNETIEYMSSPEIPLQGVRWVQCNRTFNFSRDYYTRMAKMSTGKYIWALNDDVVLQTKNWDILLSQHIDRFLLNKKDRIVYIGIYDNTDAGHESPDRQQGYSCFPILTREFVEATQKYFPETVPTWGGDGAIWDIFKKIPDRILNARSLVKIDHRSIHNGHNRDIVSKEIEVMFVKNGQDKGAIIKEQNEMIESLIKVMDRKIVFIHPDDFKVKKSTPPSQTPPKPIVSKGRTNRVNIGRAIAMNQKKFRRR